MIFMMFMMFIIFFEGKEGRERGDDELIKETLTETYFRSPKLSCFLALFILDLCGAVDNPKG